MQQNQSLTPESLAFRILVAGTDLKFHDYQVSDPVPTGRQIIEVAAGRPAAEFIVLEWLKDGDLEELELDETTDLRAPGAERFIVARSSQLFKFEIDGKRHSWPDKTIAREVLLAIAQQDPAKFSVWQEFQKKPDEEITAGHPAQLSPEGLERFYTVMKHTTEGLL
ncbi:MAG: multiubiquitin domain-containing protein [Parvibaculum sp.]|nr:multiubiquitin domain-containing protein [Parvibaculum sp.]